MTGERERKEETNDHYHHDIIVPGEQQTSPGDAQPSALPRPGPGQGSESDHDRSSDTDLSSRESGDQDQVTRAHGHLGLTSNCVF